MKDQATPDTELPDPSARPVPSPLRVPFFFRPALESSLVGLALGLADAHYAGESRWAPSAYLVAGLLLGCRHAGRAWPCWVPLGISLYVAHVAAIALGYKPPYVEKDAQAARGTLIILYEAGAGLAMGAAARRLFAALGAFERAGGPPVRLTPRTTRGVMVAIAEIGITLGLLRWLVFDGSTIYSTAYDEGRFQQVRVGMTTREVEALVGRPLEIFDWPGAARRNWAYTRKASGTSNYWRRWIIMTEGKVEIVVSDFWWD